MPFHRGGLLRAGKNKWRLTPKVEKKEKKKPLTGRAKKRKQFNTGDANLNRTKKKSGPMEQSNVYLLYTTEQSWSPTPKVPIETWYYEKKLPDNWTRKRIWARTHYQEKGQQWRRPILQDRKNAIDLVLEDEQLPEYGHDDLPILPFRVVSQRVLRSSALVS